MKKVTGIGGVFYKVNDVQKHKDWYAKHLGVESGEYGGKFVWREDENPEERGMTAWSPFPADSKYFGETEQKFMVNYRVENLEELLKQLKKEGVQQLGEMEVYDYGKFAWIIDCDGHKVELWEPGDASLLDG